MLEIGQTPLVSEFESLLLRADLAVAPTYPKPVEKSVFSAENRTTLFSLAQESWQSVFEPEVITQSLSEVNQLEVGDFRYIKFIRRFGVVLGSAYRAFDLSHLTPHSLHEFLKSLGKINDAQNTPLLEEQKKIAAERLKDLIQDSNQSLDPAPDSSFAAYVDQVLIGIETAARERELPVKTFHTIRKDIRGLMNLLRISLVVDFDEMRFGTFKYLLDLNRKLGEDHDLVIARSLRGEVDYDSSQLPISSDIAERIFMATSTFSSLR